ncbi:MAG: GRP family sugar transporter, partial [Actinomycetaceae bacterium UMB1218B]|nr:GRP family sugar transporter [Actinomycetaceae bacterium UMB1218B]
FVSRTEEGSDTKNLDWARGTRLLMTSTFAFSSYVLIGRAFGLDGPSILLPQATGYFLVALIAYAVDTRRKGDEAPKLVSLPMAQMTALGLMWGAAVVLLQVGAGRVGVATGFTLSQLGILISTPLGILWLGEHRVGRELCWTVIGVALVIVGAVLAGVAKGLDAA